MPRIRRWFPVSHDINSDAEVWAMRHEIGEKSLSVWLEALSIADRHDGELPGPWNELLRSIAAKCQASRKTVSGVFEFAKSHVWIVSDPALRVLNYSKYHPSREEKEIPQGNGRGSPLTSETSETYEINSKDAAPGADSIKKIGSKNSEEAARAAHSVDKLKVELGETMDWIYNSDPVRFKQLVVWRNGALREGRKDELRLSLPAGWGLDLVIETLKAFWAADTKDQKADPWPYLQTLRARLRSEKLQRESGRHKKGDLSSVGDILNDAKSRQSATYES